MTPRTRHMANLGWTAVACVAALALAPSGLLAQRADRRPSTARPMVNGTFTDSRSGQGTFSGTIALSRVEVRAGSVAAVGTLMGTLANSAGDPLGAVSLEAALPVTIRSAACEQLQLELGTVTLDLSGTPVHLRQVVLQITPSDSKQPQVLAEALCATAVAATSRGGQDRVAQSLTSVIAALGLAK